MLNPSRCTLALSAAMFLALAGCAASNPDEPLSHWRSAPLAEPVVASNTQTPPTRTPAGTSTTTLATPAPTAFAIGAERAFAPASAPSMATAGPLPSDRLATDDSVATPGLAPATFGEEGDDFDPCLSRDGSRLVYASTQHRTTSDIFVKNVTGRMVTQLTNEPAEDAMPSFSPDGSTVAFASNRNGNWDLFVMSAAGGKALQLTDGAEDEVFPSWSPDGSRLVFSRQNIGTGRWEMWTLPLSASGNPSFIGNGYRPRWCPVGGTGVNGTDRVLFQLGRERGSRSFGIWCIDVGTGTAGQPSMLASNSTDAFINPEWSPDGSWIAYARAVANENANPATGFELWMMNAEGEGQVRLTGTSTSATSPAWAAQDRLFFVSNRDGRNGVWSMDMTSAIAAAQLAVQGPVTAATESETPSETLGSADAGQ